MLLLGALLSLGLVTLLPSTGAYYSIWKGTWKLYVGEGGHDRTLDCRYHPDTVVKSFKVTLDYPDVATDEFGNVGEWTSVYDLGIEIIIQGRKFYSIPWKRWRGANATKDNIDCFWHGMDVGWSHDLLGNNWACFYGIRSWRKPDAKAQATPKPIKFADEAERSGRQLFRSDLKLIQTINEGQSFWEADRYPQFENLTVDDITSMAGGKYSVRMNFPATGKPTPEQVNASLYLPTTFDWRNVRGQNYVSPVRNQGHCGSCYAFAATAMQESRVRILTKNAIATTYSPQDVVDCSPYAFGCGGGLLFSEAKFAEDFGYAEESCNAYQGIENKCSSLGCKRSYATDYEFIGTSYGGCNELAMRLAIFHNGPIVTGYTIYRDFIYYKTGIYYHYGGGWPLGGHAVTIVGWGEDPKTGTKFWIVKNSWGADWGEDGYFRIIRGLNECRFESSVWQATPLL